MQHDEIEGDIGTSMKPPPTGATEFPDGDVERGRGEDQQPAKADQADQIGQAETGFDPRRTTEAPNVRSGR